MKHDQILTLRVDAACLKVLDRKIKDLQRKSPGGNWNRSSALREIILTSEKKPARTRHKG